MPQVALSEDRLINSIPYITLRNILPQPTPDSYYGDERHSTSMGVCTVQWDRSEVMSNIGEMVDFYLPQGDAQVIAVDRSDEAEFWVDYAKKLNREKPLLYVHGYNISFEKACLRARELQQNLGLQNRLVLFSWPSDGAVLNYTRDEADIAWSVLPLADVIGELSRRFGADGLDIVGHSLGGRGVVLAMSRVVNAHNSAVDKDYPVVDHVVLAAADMDAGRARQHLSSIRHRVSNITLYTSSNDRALRISENLHGYPRLGQTGEHLADFTGVDVIDATELRVRRASGHLYHLANGPVVRDLSELLNDRKSADKRSGLQQSSNGVGSHWTLVDKPDKQQK